MCLLPQPVKYNTVKNIHLMLKLGILFVMLSHCSVSGQLLLDSILISDTVRFQFNHIRADNTYDSNSQLSVIDFLTSTVGGQVQTISPGGLTTFLHRGMANRHLPVLWNGINIQSVVNGSYDLSLIPSSLYNGLNFYTSGTPTLTGNNSISGTLDIKKENFQPSFQISTHISTLQNYAVSLLSSHHKNNYSGYAGLEYGFDRNIFMYKEDQKSHKRTATDLKKMNIIYEGKYSLTEKQLVSFDFWYQKAERNIPTSITASAVPQQQKDKNIRIKSTYLLLLNKNKLVTTVSYMHENLDYLTQVIDSRSKVQTLTGGLEYSGFGPQNLYTSLMWRHDRAEPNFYTSRKNRNNLQWALGKRMKTGHLITQLSLRQDLVNSQWMPFSFTWFNQWKKTSLQVSRNYNLPGFNDLYWPTGGNLFLKTEKSWQTELKTDLAISAGQIHFSFYGNLINDWIQWIPQNTVIWNPVNQKKVFSRGFEITILKKYKTENWIIIPEINFIYNKTTALDHYYDKSQIGKQLIYIPQHKVITHLKLQNKNHHVLMTYQFSGKRFDTTDHSNFLPSMHLVNAGYSFVNKKFRYQLSFNNLFNYQYSLVRYFPMPGIQAEMKWTFLIP